MDLSNKTYEDLMRMLTNVWNVLNNQDRYDSSQISKANFRKKRIYEEFSKRTLDFKQNKSYSVMNADGVLSAFGYHVGDYGISCPNKRFLILKLIIDCTIPPIKDAQYINKWGTPCSAKRMETLQRTLRGFIISTRRKNNCFQFRRALKHWEHDLAAIENLQFHAFAA